MPCHHLFLPQPCQTPVGINQGHLSDRPNEGEGSTLRTNRLIINVHRHVIHSPRMSLYLQKSEYFCKENSFDSMNKCHVWDSVIHRMTYIVFFIKCALKCSLFCSTNSYNYILFHDLMYNNKYWCLTHSWMLDIKHIIHGIIGSYSDYCCHKVWRCYSYEP